MKIKIVQFFARIVMLSLLSMVSLSALHANEMVYQERVSDIIINSLQEQEKHVFLKQLYAKLFFMPVWMQEKKLSTMAKELFSTIQEDKTLNSKGKLYTDAFDLQVQAKECYSSGKTIQEKVALEFKISQLYEAYTNYSYFGSINWGAFATRISNLKVNDVRTEWVLHRPEVYPITMVEKAALGESLAAQLKSAIATKYHYKALRNKLIEYRKIESQGGWKKIIFTAKVQLGRSDIGVSLLRERLRMSGDYTSCSNVETMLYDTCLQKAVKNFQARHGLIVDGSIGRNTLGALNETVEKKIIKILLNLDRIKWLKVRKGTRHIVINIPDFKLYFEEAGKLKQTIKVVVGKPKNPTPIFSNIVKTVVLNPYWNLPKSIIQKEMIPKLMKNAKAMARKGIEIRDGWGVNAAKINPASVDWSEYQYSKSVPFRFAQVPGPKNALGKIKFLFPNKYAVYMHDTPAKKLFSRNKRAFSHGCIRLHKPKALLKTFTEFNSNINFKKAKNILKGKKKTPYTVKNQVPIDVVYLTAWVGYNGALHFASDVYHYDKMQLKSFKKW